MTSLYLVDTENVSYIPKSADEAIILFNRLKAKNQVDWERVPELLQHCAQALDATEHDRFCSWICNPCDIKPGKPGYFSALCDQDNSDQTQTVPPVDDEKESCELCDHPAQDHNTVCDSPICNASSDSVPELCTPADPEEL